MAACRSCGSEMSPGISLCNKCGAYTVNDPKFGNLREATEDDFTTLDKIEAKGVDRLDVGEPANSAWGGGGIVPGSTTLFGGMPGSGKTTLTLQIIARAIDFFKREKWGYFISAEQMPGDFKITADRIGLKNQDRFVVLKEMGAGRGITPTVLAKKPPAFIALDSLNALCGKDIYMMVEVAKEYKQLGVKLNVPVFLIGHMQKQGDFAGLLKVQHEVDTLIVFEMNEREGTKHLIAYKNRFGATNIEHKIDMTEFGLQAPPKKHKSEARAEAVWENKLSAIIDAITLDPDNEMLTEIIHDEAKRILREAVRMRMSDKLQDILLGEADALIDVAIQPEVRKAKPKDRKLAKQPKAKKGKKKQ
jgi:DNA repair protein RadA/Sms